MKVFVFDLLAYGENLDHLKDGGTELPYPLSKRHFKADVAVRTYAEHLDAWEELDRLGYDGVGFNEHHCSPYGLMNSPNLMAAAAAQRTKRLKLLIYGNLLPLHEPLRLAEELAMLDCLSNGRMISGFARGIPREYQVHNVPLADSRARFEEAYDIVTRAWTEDVFSYAGKFWSYKDVAIWPRPVQQPHPPIWIPIVGSKESIEFAGRHDIPITPGLAGGGLRDDIIRFYAKCLAAAGHRITPDHLSLGTQRLCRRLQGAGGEGGGALSPLFQPHAVQPRQLHRDGGAAEGRLRQPVLDRLRAAGEPARRGAAARGFPQHDHGATSSAGRAACPGARRDEVAERIIDAGRSGRRQHGADRLQSRRHAPRHVHEPDPPLRREVLPRLQAHEVKAVPPAEAA